MNEKTIIKKSYQYARDFHVIGEKGNYTLNTEWNLPDGDSCSFDFYQQDDGFWVLKLNSIQSERHFNIDLKTKWKDLKDEWKRKHRYTEYVTFPIKKHGTFYTEMKSIQELGDKFIDFSNRMFAVQVFKESLKTHGKKNMKILYFSKSMSVVVWD